VSQQQQGGGAVDKAESEKQAKEGSGNAALALLRRATKKTLAALSNLPLAISEMFAIAALMALGTGCRL
jgi:cytochrome c biogenesis protein